MVGAQQRREAVRFLGERGCSERRGCALCRMGRSGFRYRPHPRDDEEERKEIRKIARREKRYGYRRVMALMRRKGEVINHKKMERIWKEEGLSLARRKRRRRRGEKGPNGPLVAEKPGHVWTYDFMEDRTWDGRKLRILTVVDEFTRESPAIGVERAMKHQNVIEVLKEAFGRYGAPEYLRSDNGPEFVAAAVKGWLREKGVRTHYIDPGSPWQNAYGESFNDKVRVECLNLEVFEGVREAKVVVESWRRRYNRVRPHSSLGYLTPREFRKAWEKTRREPGALFSRSAPGSLRSLLRGGRSEKKSLVVAQG